LDRSGAGEVGKRQATLEVGQQRLSGHGDDSRDHFWHFCCSGKGDVGMSGAIEQVYSSLSGQFRGDLLRPGDTEFSEARRIWNGMVARKPGLIARCTGVRDVQAVVRSASAAGVFPAIRCGGHSLAGFSSCEDGLVIDLTRMRQVNVDETN